jgi:uncharacterized membrane protein YphA (DoxX/SURF4 family)
MKNSLIIILSSLLVLLFLYTGLAKLLNLKEFANTLNNQPLPKSILPWLLWLVPFVEMVTALLLLIDRTRLIGLWSSLVIMLGFTVYTALVLLNVFAKIPCSCGGVIRQLTWKQHLVFNIFFLLLSATAIKICMHQNRVSRKPANRVGIN